jgi:hypothetical protein
VELMTPKLLAETAGMIGVQEMRDAFREVNWEPYGASGVEKDHRDLLLAIIMDRTRQNQFYV